MAEGAAIEAVVGKLVEYLMDAMKEQVSYLCCYSCNVQGLADEVQKLNVEYESVQQSVGAASSNLQCVSNKAVVDSWLTKIEGVKTESDRIRNVAEEVQGKCLCKWLPVIHYCVSRDAVKATETATELRMHPPVPEFVSPIPAEFGPVPDTSIFGFESRNSIEEAIMDSLKDKQVYLIGIWGTGGVGKTTMAKKIEERVLSAQKSMFDHVVTAVVSQQPDPQKIQRQIARALGLELKEQDNLIYGARKLHERLKGENSILIILDDVWHRLNLHELGIPSQSTHVGCKLLLTSRNQDAFTLPGNPVSKIFNLEILTPEDSWILFRENAGIQDDPHDDLIQIAKDVARECQGLPLALKTVGLALREARKSSWENALGELQQSMPVNISGVREDVYKPLMYSVNCLESEEARYLFLLCCLFPEDCDITLETLVRCRMALKGSESLMVARNKVETITRNLISRSLLIESNNKRKWNNSLCVKMHDVIRDVGIWIASEEKIESEGKIASEEKQVFMISHGKEEWPIKEEDSYRKYTGISLIFCGKRDIGILECINYPRLEFLLLDGPRYYSLNLPMTFFSGMKRLRYLCASNSGSLPSSVGLLKNLRTLHLKNCGIVETISEIGKLTHLEILYLTSCEFMVLPIEIGGLEKLRQLVISYCRSLKRIELGVFLGLVRLEELSILHSSNDWKAEENGITNTHLAELDCLNHLTTLKIDYGMPTLPHWVSKLKEYYIVVSTGPSLSYYSATEDEFQKAIKVGYNELTPLGDWFYDIASDVDYLDVAGPSCPFFVEKLAKSKNGGNSLKHLSLSEFTNVQYFVEEDQKEDCAIFPMLEFLHIKYSDSLQEISNVPLPSGSFEALAEISLHSLRGLMRLWTVPTGKLCLSNLTSIGITDCQSLSYLFSLSVAQSLSQLEVLNISRCSSMEHIFAKEDGEETGIHMLEFPKLYYLEIGRLKSLHDLCQGVNRIKVFKLSRLVLDDLPSIKGKGGPDIHHEQSLFDHLQIAGNYNELEILRVESINIKCLFPPSMLRGSSNLQTLKLTNCSMLEEVIGNDKNVGETTLFPKLKELYLSKLPKILTFWCGGIELPSLEELHIEDCPLMESFSKGPSHASNSSLPFFSKEIAGSFDRLKKLILRSINFKCLFPPSMLRSLSNLEELELRNCSMLEEVRNDKNVEETTLFPKLKKLSLFELPKILTFWCGAIEFPSLEQLHIYGCPLMENFSKGFSHASNSSLPFFSKEIAGNFDRLKKLILKSINFKCLFPPSMLRGLSNLEDLKLINCSMLEEVIENDKNVGEKTLFPKLKYLYLSQLPKILTFCCGAIEFPSLEELDIYGCPLVESFSKRLSHASNSSLAFFSTEIAGNFNGLKILRVKSVNFKYLFLPSMLRGLSNLEELKLTNCSMLEEVIGNGENLGETALFPKLKDLYLSKLSKIHTFWCGAMKFPSLEKIHIEDCPLMESFSKRPSHSSNSSLPFFRKEVFCPQLMWLNLKGLHNTTRIFALPTFRALTNLKSLNFSDCEKLKEVIAEEEADGPTNIKEILSPQLKELYMRGLPISNRFCRTKRSLEFPSLKTVGIWDCPMLKRFSLGTLHLPNITRIYMGGLSDADFFSKFFYNKEISSDQIHLEKDCFIMFIKQMSIEGIREYDWFIAPYSSENFIDAIYIDNMPMGITGTLEITMLLPGVLYEIIFMIMLDKDIRGLFSMGWVKGVEFELKLLGGLTQHQVKTVSEQPRDRWIDLLVGKFTREHYQTNLQFSLYQRDKSLWPLTLSIKGVKFIKSLES